MQGAFKSVDLLVQAEQAQAVHACGDQVEVPASRARSLNGDEVPAHGRPVRLLLALPPLATVWLRPA